MSEDRPGWADKGFDEMTDAERKDLARAFAQVAAAHWIRRWRLLSGIGREALAEHAGVSVEVLAAIAHGRFEFSLPKQGEIAAEGPVIERVVGALGRESGIPRETYERISTFSLERGEARSREQAIKTWAEMGDELRWLANRMQEEGLRRGLNKEQRGKLTVEEAFGLSEREEES